MTTDIQELVSTESAFLTTQEAQDLEHCEDTIQRGVESFVAVGDALMQIRDRRLYRATHASFADYLAARWPQIGSRRQADRLIEAAEVDRDLRPIGLSVANESQARPLAPLAPAERRQAMQQATASAGGKPPTAQQIKQAAEQVRPPKPTPPTLTPLPAPAPAAQETEIVVEVPAAPTTPPALVLTPLTVAAAPAASAGLRQAEALCCLLEQALSLAEGERDRVRRESGGVTITLPDDRVEAAARSFLASPAIKGAAGLLAMWAQQVEG